MTQYFLDFSIASIAGIVGTFVGHPLDTIKCRLQVNYHQYNNTMGCFLKTIREEKLFGLFKGVIPPILNQFPVNAIFFSEYYRMYRLLETKYPKFSKDKLYFLSGLYSVPSELIKCKQQLITTRYAPFREIFWDIYKTKGFTGFFKGFWVLFNRDFITCGFYFYIFYKIKDYYEERNRLNNWILLMAGGITGAFTWFITYPFDTLKTFIQTHPGEKTLTQWEAYKLLTQNSPNKFAILYKGLEATMIRAFFVNAVIFYVNELGQNYLKKKNFKKI